jgi:hypothetical protein
LYSAAQKAGIQNTEDWADKFYDFRQRVEDATTALNKAKIANEIKFGSQTAFLSPEDVQIANQLKAIYPDVTTALNSSEASAMRLNNEMKTFSDTSRTATEGFASDFVHAMAQGTSAWQSFEQAGSNALNKIADKLLQMAVDNLWSNAFGGLTGNGFLSFLGIGGGSGAAAQAASASTLANNTGGAFFGPGFADGTDSAPGGLALVGERGPEIVNLPRGSQVFPNGTGPNIGGSVNAPVTVNIDAKGADPAGLARLQQQIADLKQTLPGTIVKTVTQAKKMRAL